MYEMRTALLTMSTCMVCPRVKVSQLLSFLHTLKDGGLTKEA